MESLWKPGLLYWRVGRRIAGQPGLTPQVWATLSGCALAKKCSLPAPSLIHPLPREHQNQWCAEIPQSPHAGLWRRAGLPAHALGEVISRVSLFLRVWQPSFQPRGLSTCKRSRQTQRTDPAGCRHLPSDHHTLLPRPKGASRRLWRRTAHPQTRANHGSRSCQRAPAPRARTRAERCAPAPQRRPPGPPPRVRTAQGSSAAAAGCAHGPRGPSGWAQQDEAPQRQDSPGLREARGGSTRVGTNREAAASARRPEARHSLLHNVDLVAPAVLVLDAQLQPARLDGHPGARVLRHTAPSRRARSPAAPPATAAAPPGAGTGRRYRSRRCPGGRASPTARSLPPAVPAAPRRRGPGGAHAPRPAPWRRTQLRARSSAFIAASARLPPARRSDVSPARRSRRAGSRDGRRWPAPPPRAGPPCSCASRSAEGAPAGHRWPAPPCRTDGISARHSALCRGLQGEGRKRMGEREKGGKGLGGKGERRKEEGGRKEEGRKGAGERKGGKGEMEGYRKWRTHLPNCSGKLPRIRWKSFSPVSSST